MVSAFNLVKAYCIDLDGDESEQEVDMSIGACYLNFSPFENWLVVGIKATESTRSPFRLYNLIDNSVTTFMVV